ncbi:MAG: site-specific integrase [Bacteroidales bacterium]|nr:site-specific integrase [Bacteroidales bacterium]
MKRMTFKILFVAKQSRSTKTGEIPVLLRVTVNGQRCETSIALRVKPEKWNAVAERVIGDSREDQELNFRLDTIRMRIMQIYREMEFDNVEINAKKIIDQYLGRNEKPAIMLLDVFREHNERCHKLAGKDMAPATVERYETSLKHTANFMQFSYGKEDIPITDVNHKFIKDYEFYLKTERNCSHNSATKYLKNFKKIIRIALANEYITKDPFVNIRFTLDEVERDFLEDSEIQRIIDKPITIERLANVRDVFVFQCFTGLSYSDVKGLKQEHIATDNNGKLWIRKKRQKTNNMCNIPLLDVSQQILERYKTHPECIRKGILLPVPCNQKLNAYLKELADICGIEKQISSHTGRHSYATSVCLANGVSIENVAKMLGHSDTKMTRHYAKVLDKSIMRDMEQVNGKFSIG